MSELEKNVVDSYAKSLERLSGEAKAELIKRLSQSKERDEKEIEEKFWATFGAWPSDKSAEEIIEEIRSSRHFRDRDVSF